MPIFSQNDREVFEEMVQAIQACTLSTEMLFREKSILADCPPFLDPELDKEMEDYLWFPEDWS